MRTYESKKILYSKRTIIKVKRQPTEYKIIYISFMFDSMKVSKLGTYTTPTKIKQNTPRKQNKIKQTSHKKN